MRASHCLENEHEYNITVSLTLVIQKKKTENLKHISLGNCQAVISLMLTFTSKTGKSDDAKQSEAKRKASWQSLVCP